MPNNYYKKLTKFVSSKVVYVAKAFAWPQYEPLAKVEVKEGCGVRFWLKVTSKEFLVSLSEEGGGKKGNLELFVCSKQPHQISLFILE